MVKVLLLIDLINEIVHPDGKLSKIGYPEFIRKHNTFFNLKELIKKARNSKVHIIHVKIGFSHNYLEVPNNSPLFSLVKKFEALKLNTWATEFYNEIDVQKEDSVLVKHRVSAVYGTNLLPILNALSARHVYIAGVATDLAVQTTARELHDLDFKITIVEDCCAAASDDDHNFTISTINKISEILKISEVEF